MRLFIILQLISEVVKHPKKTKNKKEQKPKVRVKSEKENPRKNVKKGMSFVRCELNLAAFCSFFELKFYSKNNMWFIGMYVENLQFYERNTFQKNFKTSVKKTNVFFALPIPAPTAKRRGHLLSSPF